MRTQDIKYLTLKERMQAHVGGWLVLGVRPGGRLVCWECACVCVCVWEGGGGGE